MDKPDKFLFVIKETNGLIKNKTKQQSKFCFLFHSGCMSVSNFDLTVHIFASASTLPTCTTHASAKRE